MKRVKLTESQLERLESEIGTNQAEDLARKIDVAITSIDDSMSYKEFAEAVAIVLKEQYGEHNFEAFMNHLSTNL
tara:strand:- start:503 stop:727 length:225 start_codon:yes stop_codon:yes gene_type:complete